MKKNKKNEVPLALAVLNSHCAAIDVGSTMMMVSYSDAQGKVHLLETDAFTESLHQLANTLEQAGVKTVAMEATGVYWIAVYQILEQRGFAVTLVNAKHFKNVDAQKTDVKDCQWLHQLHANGLLRASHIAPEVYRELRGYLHQRDILQNQKSDTLNRIHKVLTQMNVKVQHLISDIEGVAGMKLLQGIASGITDASRLLSLIDTNRLKANEEDLLKSLNGVYEQQYIIILQHSLKAFDFFKSEMKSYELHIENVLKKLLPYEQEVSNEIENKIVIDKKKGLVRKNQYSINIKEYLNHIIGIDLTQIDGIDEINALEILSVTGLNMNKWLSAEHFASWLNLSPRPKKSGGKVIGYDKRFTNNKATQAFRMAAQTMWQQKGPLGNLYRRLAAQKGSKKANKAVARKIAVIFYHMVKNKTEYNKDKLKVDTERQKAKKIRNLKVEAAKYGFSLNPKAIDIQPIRATSL